MAASFLAAAATSLVEDDDTTSQSLLLAQSSVAIVSGLSPQGGDGDRGASADSLVVPIAPTQPPPPSRRQERDSGSHLMSNVEIAGYDSPELRALKALKWKSGRELTAHVQDVALRQGKRAMVATSGGSFKKFVCSSETPCPWLLNAVCTRPRARKKGSSSSDDDREESPPHKTETSEEVARRKYWYISSGHLVHSNCTGMPKPTARQLKDLDVLKNAVQQDSRVSSVTLMEQLKSQARLLCSKSMVYKAKIELLDEIDTGGGKAASMPGHGQKTEAGVSSDVVESTQRLPGYLSRLSALNPGVLFVIERDPAANAHFSRAIIALDPLRFFSKPAPLIFGIDSVKGAVGQGAGTQLVCVGSDGNLSTITYAFALVPEPSEEQFTWVLSKLVDCGYPLQSANAVFTDGLWPVSAACARVGIPRMIQDTRSLIDELNRSLLQSQRTFAQLENAPLPAPGVAPLTAPQSKLVWSIQEAETEAEFYAALLKLELPVIDHGVLPLSASQSTPNGGGNPMAAQQLRAVDPRRWALFPHLSSTRLFGWQTTRAMSSRDQSSAVMCPSVHELRLPCEYFKLAALSLMKEAYQHHEQAVQWEREQRVVTPEAERIMQDEMKLVAMYEVAMSAPHIAFVWDPQKAPQIRQRRVDLLEKTCTCRLRLQFGVPCRHILSVLRSLNSLSQSFDFFDDCYRVTTFASVHKGHHIELPLEETLDLDLTWLPPRYALQPDTLQTLSQANGQDQVVETTASKSNAKKRRIRVKEAELRKRRMYKCRKCSVADGHNSTTCPNKRSEAT